MGRALWITLGLFTTLSPAQERDRDLAGFVDALARWRGGQPAAHEELTGLGERLCELHDRCDARDIAAFYGELGIAARARGLAAEAKVDALRDELTAAGHEGLEAGAEWPELRLRLVEDLTALCAPDEDPAPAARALALLARLELSIVEEDSSLDVRGREHWITAAAGHVERSVQLFESCGMITPRLEPLWIRGRLARVRGDRLGALTDQTACLELAEHVGNLDYQERAILALVQLAQDVGDHHAVEEHLSLLAQRLTPAQCWPLVREHAGSLLSTDRPEAALAFLLEYPPRADGHRDAWHALLTSAYLRSGDLPAARREVAQLTAADEVSCLARAAVALSSDTSADALHVLMADRSGWSARGRAEAWVLEGEAHLAAGDTLRAQTCLDAALAEAHTWSGGAQEPGSIMGEWLGLHAVGLAARVQAQSGDPVGAAVLIEDAQAQTLREPGERVSTIELLEWASRFERGLVTWSIGADGSVCAWVRPDGTGGAVTSSRGRKAWRTAVRRLREAVIAGDERRTQRLAEEIEAELFPEQLRAELADAGSEERLLLCLHGPLEGLPLSVLSQGFTPVVLPGLPRPSQTPAYGPHVAWRLLGAPATKGAPALPGAARELADLARRHPNAGVYTGSAFRRGALLEALASGDALHIATHLTRDVSCDDPRLASVGLMLSSGEVLCASEVLATATASPLVVLAACETAGGRAIDAEGIHGLARAFLEAGTRDLVVTLWPVADEAARAFAQAFHAALEVEDSPARAVRAAQESLRREGRPLADWSAFRLMGRD